MNQVRSEVVLSPIQGFLIGGIAKTVATVCTYPLQVAQVKLRGYHSTDNSTDNSTIDGSTDGSTEGGRQQDVTAGQIIEELWEKEGMGGLFQGLESKIIQSALTSAFVFGSYEAILGFFSKFSSNRPPRN